MPQRFTHPLILGHRGASAEAPENTLKAFRLARAQGADGVELDVQRSADGVPVVIHDETLERTTRGAGRVSAHPWGALARLDAGEGERIPSLEQAAIWAAEAGAWLNVELKAAGVEAAVLAVLERAGILPRTILSSFDPEVVRQVGRLAPAARRFLLRERWDAATMEAVRESGAGGVCLENSATSSPALDELRAARLPVIVWTVDDPARARMLLRAGVAGLITNVPSVGVAARRAAGMAPP
jgi:glycerophosphoryl diester phosphodiesterase